MPEPNNGGAGCQGSPVRGAPQARAEGPTLTTGGGVVGVWGLPAPRRSEGLHPSRIREGIGQ